MTWRRPDALSPSEARVLKLVAQGLSNREIAQRLGVKIGTVRSQLSAVFDILHVSNRTQATLAAIRLGLIQ